MITIHINRLRIHACHGVMTLERIVGQDFEVTLRLEVDYDGSDNLEATVNYADICALIKREMQTPSALIEHAATNLALALRKSFPAIRRGNITLAKLDPPMPFSVESVAVSLDF